ncbi:MAG: hypothetical protein WCK37_00750 [Candidatus Falkowbacteria bacterium]
MRKSVLIVANNLAMSFSFVTALLYLIIYLSHGHIPMVHSLRLFEKQADAFWGLPVSVEFPFSLSQAWDVIFTYIFGFGLYLGINYLKGTGLKQGNFWDHYLVAFVGGSLLLIINPFTSNIASVVSTSVLISLIVIMIPGLVAPRSAVIIFALVTSFIVGTRFGFLIGFLFGAVFSLIFTLSFLLAYGIFVISSIIILVKRRTSRHRSDIDGLLENSNQWGSLK